MAFSLPLSKGKGHGNEVGERGWVKQLLRSFSLSRSQNSVTDGLMYSRRNNTTLRLMNKLDEL